MRLRVLLFTPILILEAVSAWAQPVQPAQARVADAYGTVEKRLSSTDVRWQPLAVGDVLNPNSSIRTGNNSAVLLTFPEKHTFRVGEQTEVQLKELGENQWYSFAVLRGQIWSFVNKAKRPAKYEVETPSTILGVSGTLFSVEHDTQTNESEVTVADGEVSVRHGNETRTVPKGYLMRLRRGEPAPTPVKHDDQVKQMWSTLQRSESWTKGNTAPKLNQQVEQKIRNVKQQRQAVQQKQLPERKQNQNQNKRAPQKAKKR